MLTGSGKVQGYSVTGVSNAQGNSSAQTTANTGPFRGYSPGKPKWKAMQASGQLGPP